MASPAQKGDIEVGLWRRAYAVFEQALDRPAAEREAFARQCTSGEPALLPLVLDLLQTASEESLDEAECLAPESRLGTTIGRYEITGKLGRGAMGHVYAARDKELGRVVALKFFVAGSLPEGANGAERLIREAKAASALNHPNTVTVFDVVRQGSEIALAMELVEGTSLREFCGQPQPAELIIRWGRQIAQALAATHALGIVHRDIKPENVMVRPDGYVKVLDFGLARRSTFSAGASRSTIFGVLAGTLDYMSPEQTRGETVDSPSDIFSCGTLLYELVCGRHPFQAGSPIDTAYAISHSEPRPPHVVCPQVPDALSSLLLDMLAKSPARRPSAREVDEQLASLSGGAPSLRLKSPNFLRVAAGLAILAVLSALAYWYSRPRGASAPSGQVVRYSIALPVGETPRSVAVSPKGDQIAYLATGPAGTAIYRRFLDSGDARLIPGSESGQAPFFSPDGQEVGFFLDDRIRLASASGQRDILSVPKMARAGGGWADDGYIYFNANNAGIPGISRVPARGGKVELVLNSVSTNRGYDFRLFDQRLSGGLLFSANRGPVSRSIEFLDQSTSSTRRLIEHGMGGQVLPTGHLLYYWNGSLLATPFDLRSNKLSGSPIEVLAGVAPLGWNGGAAQVSASGTLVYLKQPPLHRRKLVWVTPAGRETTLSVPPGDYEQAEVSPDGLRVALVRRDGQFIRTAWLMELKSGVWTNLFESSVDLPRLTWSPDSRSLVAGLPPEGGQFPNLYRISIDSPDKPVRLTEQADFGQFPTAWSSAANAILFLEGIHPNSESDIMLLPLSGDRRPRVLVATPGIDRAPSFSPNGNWFAYSTDTDGQVYLQDLAQSHPPRKISAPTGGMNPLWSPDGKRIFYLALHGVLMEVPVDAEGNPGTARELINSGFATASDMWTRGYSIAPDGRMLVIQNIQPDQPPTSQIHVVVNWFSDLKRLVPVP